MGWAVAADELFLIAREELPAAGYYDDFDLAENGVGAVRRFLDDFQAGLQRVPCLPGRRIRVATAASMAPFLREQAPKLEQATGASVDVVEVANRFFGETVTVAGLLAGADIARAFEGGERDDIVLLPAEALNRDGIFIDSLPLDHVAARLAPARVVTGHEVTAALSGL